MYSKSIIAFALAGLVASQPLQHHAHKREAEPEPVDVYVTELFTAYVTAGGPAPIKTAVAEVADAAAPVAAAVSSVAQQASAPAVPSSVVTVAVPPAATSSSSAGAAASSGSVPNVGAGSAGALGISYSPYNSDGSCKSADQVKSDLAPLSGYRVIRLYGVDCNQVANVYNALSPGQQLFLGVFYMDSIVQAIQTMHDGMNGDWSKVHTVSIGNELVNDGKASVEQVGQYVATGKAALTSLGYTGPVVAVDTFIAVINNPGLCAYSDYMAVNAHAFFDSDVTADQAGEWALQQIDRVWFACSGAKSVLISESGWPSRGEPNGMAVPSPQNLQTAISSLKSYIGNDVLLFTAYNDFWKSPGAFDTEQYWGILNV